MTRALELDDAEDEAALAEVLADMTDDEVTDLADALGDPDEAERSMSRFDRLVAKLVAKGHSEESAKRLAAHIGRKKYGRAGFAALAAAGRAKAKAKEAAMRSQASPGFYSRVWALDDVEILRGGKGGDGRTVAAYAAVFGQRAEIRDAHGHYYEQIARSAFRRALSHGDIARRVTVLYNHGFDLAGNPSGLGSVPIGSPVEIRDDDRGLYTVTRYNRSELADAVLAAIDNGDIRGYSFRGRVFQSDPPRVPRPRAGELPLITRTEIGLSEYGPTPIPFYSEAGIVAIRSALPQLRSLPERERIVIARALLADDGPDDTTDLTESTPDEVEAPDEGDNAPTTPADEPDPVDAQPTSEPESTEDDDEEPGAEDPATEPLLPAEYTARSQTAADIARRARVARILRTAGRK